MEVPGYIPDSFPYVTCILFSRITLSFLRHTVFSDMLLDFLGLLRGTHQLLRSAVCGAF